MPHLLIHLYRQKLYLLPCFLLTLVPALGIAQIQWKLATDIPVIVAGDTLQNPWAGGLNAGQYSAIDLNLDGQSDLVVFDRTSDKLTTFINQAGQFYYAPTYEVLFPPDLRNWVLLTDFNCDGKPDIFTSTTGGIRVFENTSDSQLSFALVADPIMTDGSSGVFNLPVNSSDIPGISDVDGDGDLDILVFDFAAGGTIEYHQNQSQETDGTCGNLAFRRVSRRWGGLEECTCGVYAFGEPCSSAGGRTAEAEHVGGKSIFLLDYDGDGDQDLAFGDENCTNLAFFENEGSPAEALFLSASDAFPATASPADGFFFPAAYGAEVTADEALDVIVAPNVYANVQSSIDFTQSSWLYRNVGSSAQPRFELAQRDFLQRDMIDHGANAAPALGDADGDGDYDLILGAERATGKARLFFYENVGTSTAPVFQLVDDDYLGLSAEGFTALKPMLADINGDGQIDLVLQSSGTGVAARLSYLLNQSPIGWDFAPERQPVEVNTVVFDTPFFYDIDQDERADLLIGRVTGKLEYLRNEGGTPAAFALVTDTLAGIRNDPFRRNLSPWIGDLNGDGSPDLLTGDGSGIMRVYERFLEEATPTATTQLILDSNSEAQESRWGRRTWWAGADLFGTNTLALVVGHAQGGVYLLANSDRGPEPEGELLSLKVFPNPNTHDDEINVQVNQAAQLLVYNAVGQLVYQEARLNPQTRYRLNAELASGVYLLKALGLRGEVAVQRLVIL